MSLRSKLLVLCGWWASRQLAQICQVPLSSMQDALTIVNSRARLCWTVRLGLHQPLLDRFHDSMVT